MVNLTAVENLKPTDLPAPPEEAIGIVRACTDPNVNSRMLGEIITHNAVLTAELLRIVNSAYFGTRTKVTSAAHAVTLLGHRALSNLALCVAVRDAFRPDAVPLLDMADYLEQSLRRAVAARCLSPFAGLDPEECFTTGLLQDFGLLVMMYVDQDRADDWRRLKCADPDERYELEMSLFGTTHDRVGDTLGKAWDLPPELRLTMAHHHAPVLDIADATVAGRCRLARCADWMAAVFTAGNRRFVIQRCGRLLSDEFGVDAGTVQALLDQVGNAVVEAGDAMGIRVGAQTPLVELFREANLRLAEDSLSYQELTRRLEQSLEQRDHYADELHRELELAREVQRSLMPRPPRECHGFQGINSSARPLSGDFYDYFPARDGRIHFCIGDVAGKGMNAALLMAKVGSLFRCLGKAVNDPAMLLAMLNQEILETSIRGMFVTMIAGRYDPDSGLARLANAGHVPALFQPTGGSIVELPADAPPVGILSDAEFKCREFHLGGGALYLCTDGMIEARLPGGGALGIPGVKALIRRFNDVPTEERARKLLDAVSDAEVRDDVTLLVVDSRRDARKQVRQAWPAAG